MICPRCPRPRTPPRIDGERPKPWQGTQGTPRVSGGYGPWLGGVAAPEGLGCPSVRGVRGLTIPHEAHEVGSRSLRGVAGYLRYSEGLRRCVGAVGGVPVAGPTLEGVGGAVGVWGGGGCGGGVKKLLFWLSVALFFVCKEK